MTATRQSRSSRKAIPSSGQTWSWAFDGAVLAVLLAVYVGVQLAMLKPPALEGGDQLDYFSSAANLPDVSATHRHLRLGLLLPVRLAIELFDYTEAAYYLVPLLSGVLLCASTFLLARILFNRWVAFAAAFLVVLNPFVLWESSHLLPDMPGAALFTAGILSVTVGSVRYRSGAADFRTSLLYTLGGFLLAWSYMNREYLVVLFPLALVALRIYRIPWKKAGWIVLGMLPLLMVELIWGWIVYEDPFIRIATAGGLRGTSGTGPPYATEAGEVLTLLGANFNRFAGGWVFIVLFIGGVVLGTIAIASGIKRFWIPLVWTVGIWAFLTLLGLIPVFLTDGRGTFLRLQKFRYWLPIMPGLVILGFAAFDLGIKWLARYGGWIARLRLPGLLILVAVTAYIGIGSIADNSTYIRNGAGQYVELRDYLREYDSTHDVIYTDTGTGQALGLVLPIYTRTAFGTPIWAGEMRSLGSNTDFIDFGEIERGLVIARPESYRALVNIHDGFAPPDYLLSPPPHWEPVMISENGDVVVYSVDPEEPVVVGETDTYEWRRNDGEDATEADIPGSVTFDTDSGETVRIVDVDGLSLEAGGSQQASVQSEVRSIWGRLEAKSEGSGRLTVNCYFTSEGESVTAVRAIARDRYNVGLESIDYRCEVPDEGGPFEVDIEVDLRGPIDLTMGSNRVYLDP